MTLFLVSVIIALTIFGVAKFLGEFKRVTSKSPLNKIGKQELITNSLLQSLKYFSRSHLITQVSSKVSEKNRLLFSLLMWEVIVLATVSLHNIFSNSQLLWIAERIMTSYNMLFMSSLIRLSFFIAIIL